jgi:trehalose 6-phosphate phosphatase
MPLPPNADTDWTYFLDFDGSLVDICETPGEVHVDDGLRDLLRRLNDSTAQCVTLVSGRPIASLDGLLGFPFRAAGLHGLERRLEPEGAIHHLDSEPAALTTLRHTLTDFVAERSGLLLEDKAYSLAIHYRGAPEHAADAESLLRAALKDLSDYRLLAGKMVFELLPLAACKGQVVHDFMTLAPCHGRKPVFIGDDVTDEDGFRACNALGGISIRVGDAGDSAAAYGLAAPADVRQWLAGALAGTADATETAEKAEKAARAS